MDIKKFSPQIYLFIDKNRANVNKFMIELIKEMIQHSSEGTKTALLDLVEVQKDILLGAGRLKMNYKPPQCMITRCGLVPKGESTDLADLITSLGAKYDADLDISDNIETAISTLKCGFVFINKISRSPMEFNISGLISPEYIAKNGLQFGPQSGLTKKVLQRLATIRELPRGERDTFADLAKTFGEISPGVVSISIEVKLSDRKVEVSPDTVYVIETLGGNVFRLISDTTNNVASPRAIYGIIGGVKTRPVKYNGLHEGEILARCYDPLSTMLLNQYEQETKSIQVDDPIKGRLLNDFVEYFESRISESTPESEAEYKNIIAQDDDIITSMLLSRLIAGINIQSKSMSEYMITYMVKFDEIIREYLREFASGLAKISIPDILFREKSKAEIKKYLVDLYKDIANNAITTLDKRKRWVEYDISLKEFFMEHKYIVM
jgi:hypothetical protein